MTVQTTSSKAGPYTGNGVTDQWSTTFVVDKADDLSVIYTDPVGVETELDQAQYSVIGFGDPAGVTVTYPTAGEPISSSEKITLLRLIDYDQQTSITNQGGFYPTVIEKALDRIVMQCQQLAEKLNRAVTVSVSSDEDPAQVLVSIAQNAAAAAASAAAASGSADAADSSAADASASADAAEQAAASITFPISHENISGLGTAATEDVGTAAGNVVALDGNGKVPAVSAENMSSTGRLISVKVITGDGNYDKNDAASYIIVHVIGGGGGAGSAVGAASAVNVGGSGAGGGYSRKKISKADITSVVAVTIGNGGAGGAAANPANNGANGGTSSFGSYCSATGGKGGNGQNGLIATTNARDNSGGSGVGGDINVQGEAGYNAASFFGANLTHGTRGGTAAGPYGGPGAYPVVLTSAVATTGNSAANNSGGGGGGGMTIYNSAASQAAGGAGGSGLVIIEEYA